MPTAKSSPGTPPVPAGVQHAIAIGCIALGVQPSLGNFPPRPKVKLTWELPNEKLTLHKDGKESIVPRVISKDYTLSTDKKANLRKDLEAWRGRPFTPEEVTAFKVETILGANCLLNVIHKPSADGSKVYANVGGIMPLPKGTAKLAPELPLLVYDLPTNGEAFTFPPAMPEWIQNQIKQSEEYQLSVNPHKGEPSEDEKANLTAGDESVPF